MVAKLRAAGAIILGKTNLDEYAPAGIGRSTLGGQTCNPYDTKRITGGSSAGSAAAVAANLAICALGTDTAGSVRYPSSLNALVGMVATQGLVSRAGIVPLTFSRDRGGPMCRTVEDTAAMLEVLAGDDPRDAITARRARQAAGRLSELRQPPFARRQAARRRARLHDRGDACRPRQHPRRQRGARRHEEPRRDPRRSGRFQRRHRRDHDGLRAELLHPGLSRAQSPPEQSRSTTWRRSPAIRSCCRAARAASICACSQASTRGDRRQDTRSISTSRSAATRNSAASRTCYATKAFAGENDWLRSALGAKADTLDTPDDDHATRCASPTCSAFFTR